MEVSDVLRDRMQEPAGLQRMVMISGGAHLVLLLVILFAPGGWFGPETPTTRTVMTISLGGGAPGPQTGGMNSIGGRAVQQVQPPEQTRPEPVRPPAAVPPPMTAPAPNAPAARPAPRPQVTQAPPEARGTTPTRGTETRAGTAIAETGAQGTGSGLSTGGTGGNGMRVDVGDFCCPDYIQLMVDRIRANWDDQQEVRGIVKVRYTIQRDGRITDVSVTQSSRFFALDNSAQRAVVQTRQLPPLPAQYPNPTLTMNLDFDYAR
jgi:TonB family protein